MKDTVGTVAVALSLVACTSTTKSVPHDDDNPTTSGPTGTSMTTAGGTGSGGAGTSNVSSSQSTGETTGGVNQGAGGTEGRTGGSAGADDGAGGSSAGGTAGTGGVPVRTCETHGSECDPNATCSDTDAGIECTCAPEFEDVSGDGRECADKCDVANCSINANCRIVDAEAVCTCKADFTGDGETCDPNPDCASLGCADIAQCVEVDDSFTCQCPEGFDDDGVGPDGCTTCATDHALVDDYCIDARLVNCTDDSPPNSTPNVTSVTITYSDESGWSEPANCSWQCDAGYDRQSGQCVSECETDNGGCDPLTACSLDSDGVVCGPCPEHYTGSGDAECVPEPRCDPSKPFGLAFAVNSVNLADEVEYSMLS